MRWQQWIATASIALAGIVAGCRAEPQQLGDPVPAGTERVTLQEIQQNKATYAGRTVVIEGRVGGIGCADCGGVLVTEGTWRLLVEPMDKQRFRIEPKAGARVRAWGLVKVEGEEEEHEGNGGHHEEGEKHEEEPEDPAHETLHVELGNVELKAHGVEWL